MRQRTFIIMLAFVLGWSMYSCKEYTDDLQGLGGRVEALEDSSLKFFDINESIETLIMVAKNHGYISSFIQENDGTYKINLKGYFNGSDVLTDSTVVLKMGEAGAELADVLTITKVGDTYYWLFFGELMLDDSGKPVPVKGQDGKDGQNGQDADPVTGEYVLPMMFINPDGIWMISNDGGNTWTNTGYSANGKNGNPEPCVINATETPTTLILLVYINGQITQIVIPKLQE